MNKSHTFPQGMRPHGNDYYDPSSPWQSVGYSGKVRDKRLFLIWADKGPHMEQLIQGLEAVGHRIVYWVGLAGGEQVFKSGIFHEHFAAWGGTPAPGVDTSVFAPPSKDLIDRLHRTESLVLTMMNKRFDALCVDERRHIYYNMVGYWYGVLMHYRPHAIIFPAFPHTVYNYIIYALAQLLNIPTVMFDVPWVSDRLLLFRDIPGGSRALCKALQDNHGRRFTLSDLSLDLQEYYRIHTDVNRDATPLYTKVFKDKFWGIKNEVRRRLHLAWMAICDGSIFTKLFNFFVKRFRSNLRKEYAQFETIPDFDQPFVYVPLAFQPEASTSPLGDIFVDQILMIETLAAALPLGWLIYVKEHPGQWWLRGGINYSSNRYSGYYRRIAAIHNVRFVPVITDTYQLLAHSKAVALTSGTAGWEAVLRLKPALVFGYPWYRDVPELFRVSDVVSCQHAFQKIVDGFIPSEASLLNYLACFDQSTIHGYFETIVGQKPVLTKEESMDNILHAILYELN